MRSTLSVMALCAMTVFASACQRADQTTIVTVGPTGPSVLPECSDGRNNDPDEDEHVDANDSGCRDANGRYDPMDNSERTGSGTVTSGRPGDFNLFGTCIGSRARLSWSPADRAAGYFIERRLWTTGAWVRLSKFYAVSERTNVEVDADASAANYWRVVAVNAAGQENYSRSPEERDDKTATFACGPPAPPPPAPPTGGGPGPTPTPGPGGPTGPPTGGSCAGSSANLPSGSGPTNSVPRGTTIGFNISAPSGCKWDLTSNNHHVVSVNPSTGTGPASGSITALNVGTATICFTGNGACRTYTVP